MNATTVVLASSVHPADKMAMFVFAVGLGVAVALMVAGIADDRRQWQAGRARIERENADLLAATRQWQAGSAEGRHRAVVAPRRVPQWWARPVRAAGALRRPAPQAATVPVPVSVPVVPLAVPVTPPAGPAGSLPPPPRWPGVNRAYTSGSPAVAGDAFAEPAHNPMPAAPAPTYRGTASTGQPVEDLAAAINGVLRGQTRAAANDQPTALITPVVSARGGAR